MEKKKKVRIQIQHLLIRSDLLQTQIQIRTQKSSLPPHFFPVFPILSENQIGKTNKGQRETMPIFLFSAGIFDIL